MDIPKRDEVGPFKYLRTSCDGFGCSSEKWCVSALLNSEGFGFRERSCEGREGEGGLILFGGVYGGRVREMR